MLLFRSPAKINLFLRILRKRADGYHELASLFQAIDLCDTLKIGIAPQEILTCSDPALPLDETNLVNKALKLFRQKTQLSVSFAIHLIKQIPQQAGLGGGSSNAATTLWACNQLCGMPASSQQLMQWGAEIGADVAFFLSQGTAYCTGRGEVIRPLPSLPPTSLCIVKPIQGLSTPQVYAQLKLNALQQDCPEEILQGFLNRKPRFLNDLEEAAFALDPSLSQLKANLLNSGFSTVLLCGSGSSFFCLGHGRIPQPPSPIKPLLSTVLKTPGIEQRGIAPFAKGRCPSALPLRKLRPD